ncbi:RNA-dependent RNA polymerase [Strepsipteran arli-related virus OKIAV104]|uniref:RNA-directed RNA polymerase L n=1 Tax=Strepsipteran arli-related virus OKIAV104 TaxID=2746355 RepID=A0AAE7LSC1_9MONO|nr:RNA-dependent RNA polymerase [Strepsipteran arli-related virus OKIAV104]QMP82292.1 RNA-dependent RNA polymerase [Strepsipteran arli-related virus OKIAV104]
MSNSIDSHLRSAIRPDTRSFLSASSESSVPSYLKNVIESAPQVLELSITGSEEIYGVIFQDMFESHTLKWVKSRLQPLLQICLNRFCNSFDFMNNSLITPTLRNIASLETWYSSKVSWEDIRIIMQKLRKNPKRWVDVKSPCSSITELRVNTYACLCRCKGMWYLMDYEQIMMICDTITGRFFTLAYMSLVDDKTPGYISVDILLEAYRIIDLEFFKFGNSIYNVIKGWESYVVAVILKHHDTLKSSKQLYEFISKGKIDDPEHELRLKILHWIESLSLSPAQLSELHGIFRHWGHPTVDEVAGCRKVLDIIRRDINLDFGLLRKIDGSCKKQFCVSFVRKHGRWPRIVNIPKIKKGGVLTPLHKTIMQNTTTINFYSQRFPLEDWASLVFCKELEFNYYPDYTELLEDKSLSVPRSNLPAIYNQDLVHKNHRQKPMVSRRVLLNVLGKTEVDVRGICKTVMNRKVQKQDKIILLHSKEREQKDAPRLFAMMTLDMRLWSCALESNISEQVFPYYPQQTMTLSESELTKRLLSISKDTYEKDYLSVFCGIDFKSWNLHWNYDSTRLMCKFLDDIFGTPGLYTYSHLFFEESVIALASHTNPPDSVTAGLLNEDKEFQECDTLWYNHKGGMEGIRQKMWTLITISLLLYVEHETGIRSYIIGQGDNQNLKILLPLAERGLNKGDYIIKYQGLIDGSLTNYLKILQDSARGIGLEIKLEETWLSTVFMIYGKEMLYDGDFLPSAIKKISRTLADINDFCPTTLDSIAAIENAGLAAAQKGFNLHIPFILSHFESVMCLIRNSKWSVQLGRGYPKEVQSWLDDSDSWDWIIHMSTDFGGIPMTSPYAYLYRGHPDSLTLILSDYYNSSKHCFKCRKIYIYLTKRLYEVGEGSPELLITNPCALNIKGPKSLSSTFKDNVVSYLNTYTRNRMLRDLFDKAGRNAEQALYKYLVTIDPCYPRLMHEVFSLTPVSCAQNFVAKFCNTQTTKVMSQPYDMDEDTEGVNFQESLKSFEVEFIEYIHELVLSIKRVRLTKDTGLICPTQLANQLRNDTWKGVIPENSTIEGVTVPFPYHQLKAVWKPGLSHEGCIGFSEYILFKANSTNTRKLLFDKGCHPAYVGSRTKEKLAGRVFVTPIRARPLEAAQRAMVLRSWAATPGSSFYKVLTLIAQSRTNLDERLLSISAGSIVGGSLVHRLNDHITKRETLNNFRPNITTHVYVSTDNTGKFSRGLENYAIHFQGCIHLGHALLELYSTLSATLPDFYLHMHFHCVDCEIQIHESLVDTELNAINISSNPNNAALYTNIDVTADYRSSFICGYNTSKTPNKAYSAAFLLLSRIIHTSNLIEWGVTELPAYASSPLGIKEIMSIGLSNLINKFADLLILFIPSLINEYRLIMITLDIRIWSDLIPTCLLPEMITQLNKVSGSPPINAFRDPSAVAYCLNNALRDRIQYLALKYRSSKKMKFHNLVYHITPTMGLRRILFMWARELFITSGGEFDIANELSNIKEIQSDVLGFPTVTCMSLLIDAVNKKYGYKGFYYCFIKNKITLSTTTPEESIQLSDNSTYKIQEEASIKHFSPLWFRTSINVGKIAMLVELPESSSTLSMSTIQIEPSSIQFKNKTFTDHFYHILGYTGSSFLKYLDIIVNRGLYDTVSGGSAICLGDGEGGVSKLLNILTEKPVVYNSMIDRSFLVPHRAISYIPSSFYENPSGVLLAPLSALGGGNLLDGIFLKSFIREVVQLELKFSILTCDAELGMLPAEDYIKFYKSVFIISLYTSPNICIIKTYLTNLSVLQSVISQFSIIFETVELCVPIFSSNETLEIFVVAYNRKLNIGVKISNSRLIGAEFEDIYILDYINHNILLKNNMFISSYETLKEMRRHRIYDIPFQLSLPLNTENLLDMGKKLGFPSINTYYLDKYFSHVTHIHLGDCLTLEDVKNTRQLAVEACLIKIRGYGRSILGLQDHIQDRLALSSTTRISDDLNDLAICIFNCNLLLETFSMQTIIEIEKHLPKILINNSAVAIGNHNEFKTNIDIESWRKIYLKNFWYTLGYMNKSD